MASIGTPLAVGIPGYVLTSDLNGKILVKARSNIASIASKPAGALHFSPAEVASDDWLAFDVASAGGHGRVRVWIAYEDGKFRQYTTTSPM